MIDMLKVNYLKKFPIEWLAFLCALIGTLPLVLLTPPLQVPDEAQHYYRSYEISELRFWGYRQAGTVGDALPVSLDAFTLRFLGSVKAHTQRNLVSEPLSKTMQLRSIPLNNNHTEFLSFSGSVPYSPLAYIPQVVAIMTGRLFSFGPLFIFYFARLLNSLTSAVILFLAVKTIPYNKINLSFIGLLPMALYEYASVSPDALTISSSLYFLAVAIRSQYEREWTIGRSITAILCGAIFCSLKPVYAPLLFTVALFDFDGNLDSLHIKQILKQQALLAAIILTASFSWIYSSRDEMVPQRLGVVPKEQAAFVLSHTLQYASIMSISFFHHFLFYSMSSYGILGWLNVYFFPFLYILFFVVILGFVIFPILCNTSIARPIRYEVAWNTTLIVACTTLIMTALYLTWTPVHQTMIEGVQGRYFIPLLGMIAVSSYSVKASHSQDAALTLSKALIFFVILAGIVHSEFSIVSSYHVFG